MPAARKPSAAATDLEPSDKERNMVKLLAAVGIPQEDIADALGMSRRNLARRFAHELAHGAKAVHAKLAAKAVTMAAAGDRTMLIFVLKTKFGWREKDRQGPSMDAATLIASDPDPEHED
jgi:DNA-binding Lrp family transcriptional regulator